MSIIVATAVRRREWGGEEDPRLPIGMWFNSLFLAGDATGGFAEVDFVFQFAAAPTRDGNLYNLEQLTIRTNTEVSDFGLLRTEGMGEVDLELAYSVRFNAGPGTGFSGGTLTELRTPVFLGSQIVQGDTAAFDVAISNVNLRQMRVVAEGYIWGSRSRSVLGGPRRPVGSLYGS